jgi:acetyl esterase/lipase
MQPSLNRIVSVLSTTAIAKLKHRRAFLQMLLVAAIAAGLPPTVSGQEAKVSKKTFTYKTVQQCAIKADVSQGAGNGPHPVVVWIHGGALIMGSRGGIDSADGNWRP